jgi:hypothetical protein
VTATLDAVNLRHQFSRARPGCRLRHGQIIFFVLPTNAEQPLLQLAVGS